MQADRASGLPNDPQSWGYAVFVRTVWRGNGHHTQDLIEVEGIRTVPVHIAGWNGGYVQDRRTGERKTLGNMPSPHLNRHEIDDLYDAALAQGFHTGTLVLTGSVHDSRLAPEVYRRLARTCETMGSPLWQISAERN